MGTRRAVGEFETRIDSSSFVEGSFCLHTFHERLERRTASAAFDGADVLCRKFAM